MANSKYAITFRSFLTGGVAGDLIYRALYRLPGDADWREAIGADGKPANLTSAWEAEARAGHALTFELNKRLQEPDAVARTIAARRDAQIKSGKRRA